MAKSEGMALAPWNVLAAGKIRTDEEEEKRRQTGEKGRTIFNPEWERTDREKIVCKALEKVAQEIGTKHITAGNLSCLFKSIMAVKAKPSYSCDRVLDAKDSLCLPYCWRPQNRALVG